MTVPEIILSGSPRQKGLTHGRLARALVLRSLETYRMRFARSKGFSWEDARAVARDFAPTLVGPFAPYAEEMQGIADGAGLEFEDVLAMNLRSEILYSGLQRPETGSLAECSAFAATPPATAGGAVLAGQTWDYTRAQREATFLARFPKEGDRPAMWMPMEGGMVGGKGVNAAGISLTLNALSSPRTGMGIPLHVRMRRILEARTFEKAIQHAFEPPVAGPACLIITSADGRCSGFELDPDGTAVLYPKRGILVHTNHFISSRYRLAESDLPGGSTVPRLQRLSALLHGTTAISESDAETFLRDHENAPFSICAHPAPDTPPERFSEVSATNYAFVVNLSRGRLRFVMGNPCEGEFRTLLDQKRSS
ncbi:MAG: C45 family autoproteolytic acyltransferase/hydrolase [Kiritimatiellia bacterium]|jgi:isopenicillin-N N-acyltransferase-like protein